MLLYRDDAIFICTGDILCSPVIWMRFKAFFGRCFLSKRNNICIGPVNCWHTHKSNTKGITLALRNSGTFPGISESDSVL